MKYLVIPNVPTLAYEADSIISLLGSASEGEVAVFRHEGGRFERLRVTWEGPQNPRQGRYVTEWIPVTEVGRG